MQGRAATIKMMLPGGSPQEPASAPRATPGSFLGHAGVAFTYLVTDSEGLVRKGEARAAIVDGRLYLVTFDAPRLHYFDQSAEDARALMGSATL